MGLLSLTLPTIGQPNATEDPDVRNNFNLIQTEFNGNIEETNLKTAVKEKLGLTDGIVRRGAISTATSETRTNAAYGLLTTPDRVSGITLQSNGLIFIVYQATVNANDGTAAAALFLGATQIKTVGASNGADVSGTNSVTCNTGGTDRVINTCPSGLITVNNGGYSEITTGTLLGIQTTGNPSGLQNNSGATNFTLSNIPGFSGGAAMVWAAAGTYDVSVQFKSTTTAVTVKNRHLWVWTMAF